MSRAPRHDPERSETPLGFDPAPLVGAARGVALVTGAVATFAVATALVSAVVALLYGL